MCPRVIAHRGASSDAPENTLAAFKRAIQDGADGLEFDLHMSRDGRLVVCHDPLLDRTTNGTGLIVDHTWEELRRLDAGAWFAPEYQGERLPSLEDVAHLVQSEGWTGLLNIELATLFVPYEGIEARLVGLLNALGLTAQTLVSSFNHESLVRMRARSEDVETACLLGARLVGAAAYVGMLGCAAAHLHHLSLSEAYVRDIQKEGFRVHAWTVNSESELSRALHMGVDGIITDRPALMGEHLHELHRESAQSNA